jgi:mono/diheme cytochrome c family protein
VRTKATRDQRVNQVGPMLAMVAACVLPASAGAVELPAGPNRDVVARACGACHDLDMVYEAAGQTREGWNGTIEEMTGYGLKLSPDERAQILEYLTSFLGPEARQPR